MRRLIALASLLFATCGALADVNITNIPVALGVGTNDTLLGVTNSTHAALVPAKLLNQLFTSSLLGTSNQYTGGFVGDGTYLTHLDSGFIDWFAVEYDFTNAYFTNFTADGSGITNIPSSSIVGAVAEATHATNADNATNFWGILNATNLPYTPLGASSNAVSATYVTTSPLTNHVNIANVDTPGAIVTNGNTWILVGGGTIGASGATNLLTGRIISTNASGTSGLDLNGAVLGSNDKVIEWKTNNTSKFSVDASGTITTPSTVSAGQFANANASTALRVGSSGAIYWETRAEMVSASANAWTLRQSDDTPMLVVSNGSVSLPGTITATNGVNLMVKPSFTTNFTCTTNLQTYLCNGTNQIVTLPNAAYVPNIIYRFTSTNGYGSYIVTNATGSQTIRDGVSLSHKQIGIAPFDVFSDGAQWWLAARDQSVEPNAQFSCSTNIPLTLANTAYPVTFNSTDFNNSQGIALALGTNGTHFSKMWITNSGQYELTPSIVIGMGNVSHTVRYWFRSNDTNIPNSTTPTKVGGNDTIVVTVPFVVNISTPTAIEIWAESDGVNDALTAGAASGNYPASPSVICPVKRISDTWP